MDGSQSSLPYQMLLSLSKWFLPAFVTTELLLFFFKTFTLPYPSGNIASELLLLLFFTVIECGRISSGERGNLTEKGLFVAVSLVLSAPACTVLVYWLLWQTYVLRVEAVVVVAAMTMQGLQALLAMLMLVTLPKASKG